MSHLYYACNWVIRPYTQYRQIMDVVKALGCELVELRPRGVSEDGYHYIRFSIKVNSEVDLDEFVEKVGQKFGLDNWYKVSEEYFSQGVPFWIEQQTDYPLFWTRWLDVLNRVGRLNEEIRKELES